MYVNAYAYMCNGMYMCICTEVIYIYISEKTENTNIWSRNSTARTWLKEIIMIFMGSFGYKDIDCQYSL